MPYASAVKIGLQFKRRFWEEDEAIYGGISYTDLPIRQIAYPSSGLNRGGRGVLTARIVETRGELVGELAGAVGAVVVDNQQVGRWHRAAHAGRD